MGSKIAVKDAMSTDVKTVSPNATLDTAASKMKAHNIGCVVVKNKETVGIITETDIVDAIAAGKNPTKTKAKDIMSSQLVTVSPDDDVIKVAHLMSKYNMRRVPVMKDNVLLGIATSHDILRVAAEEEEILSELVGIRLSEIFSSPRKAFASGQCESCSNFSDNIQEVDGRLICPECFEG